MARTAPLGTAAAIPRVRRPWRPHVLDAYDLDAGRLAALRYVVVDEVGDGTVLLTITPWPVADERGRLRFPGLEESREVALDEHALRAQLYDGWLEREPRVGDVFAFALRPGGRGRSLAELVEGPVYDLSAEARKVAKLAFYAVTSDPIAAEEAQRYRLTEKIDDDREPARRHPGFSEGRGTR